MRTFSQALARVDTPLPRRPGAVRRRRLALDLAPAELFSRLRGARRLLFLDTARGEPGLGARSYLAWDPLLFVRMNGQRGELEGREGASRGAFRDDPFAVVAALERWIAQRTRGVRRALRPRGFETGLAGVFGYDLRLALERLPRAAPAGGELPDLALGVYDRVLVHDHGSGAWTSLGTVREAHGLDDLRSEAAGPRGPLRVGPLRIGRLRASVGRAGFERRVRDVVRRIHAGDVYQVNLSRRLDATVHGDPADVYLRLRETNPAPYAGYLDTGRGHVLSSSPERFLRVEGRRVTTWPIKGTRPRGETRADDAQLRAELRGSEKDRAELAMIVDLLRNDLHRVARPGSVSVERHAFVRSYAAVHHLVSEVAARLPRSVSAADLLRATFPGGSITGAPKIRACEIIDELEPVRRGAYTGALGWIGRDGDLDLNVLIRTIQIRDGRLTLHVGGGIVADSSPAAEFEETVDKARALREALER